MTNIDEKANMDKNTEKPKRLKPVLEWIITIAFSFTIAMLFHNYMYAQTKVHNVSMQNTLVENERLVIDKWNYYFKAPRRGNIVIINGPEYDQRIVKRVIGLPGEQIEIRDGLVFINSNRLEEPYVKGITLADQSDFKLVVPADKVFVMGDNREHSIDSRAFGPVAFSSLEGKAVFRIWPIDRIGGLK